MPTFNQLVRKGREQATYKSNSPAMQYSLNTLKNKETNLSFSSEARRLHRCENRDPQEAELRSS